MYYKFAYKYSRFRTKYIVKYSYTLNKALASLLATTVHLLQELVLPGGLEHLLAGGHLVQQLLVSFSTLYRSEHAEHLVGYT